jgi:mannose-binding lectin 2
MTKITRFLISILVCAIETCLTLAEWNTKDHMKREHSLVKPYIDDKWDFVGSTVATNNYIRLTPDHQSRKGGIWNNVPCMLRHWELHVHFKVHGKGNDLFGDGFALWYTKDRLELGAVFGSKDFFSGLAIFLDTYPNVGGEHSHGHPYICNG